MSHHPFTVPLVLLDGWRTWSRTTLHGTCDQKPELVLHKQNCFYLWPSVSLVMNEKKLERLQVVKDSHFLSWINKLCVVVIFVKNIAHTTITHPHLLVVFLLLLRSAVSAGHTNLMSLVHRLLPVVQLFIQVTFLFTEQILEDRTQTSEVIVVREVTAAGNQTSNLFFPC